MAMHWKFPFGRLVRVLVSHVDDSTGNVFLQINDEAGILESLMSEIEQTIQDGSLKALQSDEITVGSVYLVQYQEDNVWYRARVLSYNAHKQECEVFFFDYGNTDFVPVSCMRVAKQEFCELPSQSFECELEGIQCFKGGSFGEVVTTLNETILEQELFCEAVQLRKNCAVVVHLFVDDKGTDSVFEKIKARFATGTDAQSATNSLETSIIHREAIQTREVKYNLTSLAVDSFHDLIVTWVEDPSHFWCQLLSKAEAFAELMEDIAIEYANLRPEALPLRSCTVGYPCCAKFYDDESWNRGIITNISSIAAGQVEVRFVDFGNNQKTELKDVRDLKNKFLKFPCEAIHFTIAGVDPDSKDGLWADEAKALFEKLIKDKHVVGLVVNVESDGRHRVKLIDTTTDLDMELNQVLIAAGFGVKSVGVTSTNTLPLKSPDSCPKTPPPPVFARESVQVGVEEKVLVTTIVNPSKFFCQLFRNGPKLENLMQDIGHHYSKLGTDEEILLSPSPGDPCCAQFSEDECWYRAVVLSANSKGVAVQYIDYGNSETLPTVKIKKLIPKFSDLPKQAIECTLNRIKPKFVAGELKWRKCDTEMFQQLALEKEGQMTVVAEDSSGVRRVELVVRNKREDQNINEQLVISRNAMLADGALPASENWSNVITHTLPRPDVKVGHFEDAVVSYVEHPGNFWCQLLKTSAELHSLMEEIMIEYSKAVPRESISNPSCGMLCCAQYTDDDAWYRGKITGIKKGGLVEVHFVDYGNCEILPLSRVKVLKSKYMKLPVQAIHCELAKLRLKSEILLSDNVRIKFEEHTSDKELVIMADRYDEEHDIYAVVLLDTSEGKNLDVALELQSITEPSRRHEATCIPSLDLHPGITEHVFVSFVMSPRKFFCQLMKEADSLDELMGEMSEYYNSLADHEGELAKPVGGEFCASKFTADDAWYRARVLAVQGSTITVSYIDFGNTETLPLTRVKVLNPKFQNLPIQALECWLANVPRGCTDAEFQELVAEKEFNACIVSVESGVAEVDLLSKESKESLCDILRKSTSNSERYVPATYRVTSMQWKTGDNVNVYIPFAESVQKFFCQATKHSNELNDLMNKMEECYTVKKECLSSIEIGSFYAAWYEGGGWYRAMVNHVQGESIDVFYIDYGDTATVALSSLRTLEDDFFLLPAQAVQCCLKGFSTNPEPPNFVEIAVEQEFEAQVVNVMNGVFEVELVSRDGLLSQMLAKERESHAKPTCNVSNIQWNLGDKIQVFIPYVESAQKFFCQASQNIADLDGLMNRLEEYYSTEQNSLTSVSSGCFCVALYEEGGWYRARVNQVQGETVDVFYIDYGDSATLPLNSIREITPEFSSLPAQAVQCCLKGFSANGGPANLKDCVIEQEFEAQVISVKNGVFEIELFSDVESLSEMRVKEMEPLVTPICNVSNIQWSVGDKVQVFIPYAESVHKFFCQPSKHTSELEQLMNRLEEHYSTSQANVTSVSSGCFCVALYEEGGWYRARVNQVQEGTVDVFYIDYGDTATLPLNSIRTIEHEFLSLPAQAVQCCLKGFSVNEGQVNFKDLVVEQEFEAQVTHVKNTSIYEVELVTKDSALISEMLIEGKEPGVSILAGIKEGTYVDLCPTSCISPHLFYCQIVTVEHKGNLEQLMNQLQEYYDTISEQEGCISEPRIGMLCAAIYAGDGLWYRGKVSKLLDEQTVEVFYLDFGNYETVELGKLKLLKEEWASLAAEAVQCSIPRICPVRGTQWSSITIERFNNVTAHKQLVGKIMKLGWDNSLELELFDTTKDSIDINIGELLVKEGLACYSGSSNPVFVVKNVADLGQSQFSVKEEVFVTTVETPGCFYCQTSGNESKLAALMDQITTAYDSLADGELSVSYISPGNVCCAQFSEDRLWYRAALEEQTASSLTVRFIDYGNTETLPVNKVKILKEDFLCVPPLAIQCSLYGVKPVGSQYWVDKASVMFEELTLGKRLEAKFMSSSVLEPFEVQLFDYGTDIADELVKANLALSTERATKQAATITEVVQDFRRPLVECGQIYDVYITYIASAGTFYCQLVNLSQQLERMMNDLNNHYFQLAETEGCIVSPAIGQPCVALFEEMWYRAKVLHVSVNDLTVHYVDYGNTETAKPSGVKQIMPTFLETPVIAVECSLDLGKESWSEEATSLLEKLTGSEIQTIKVVSQQKDRFEVKVFGDMAHCISDEVLQKLNETGEEQIKKEKETLKVQYLQPGQAEQLCVVHTKNSEEFYVQLSKSYAELEKMMEEIAVVYSGLSDDVRPEDLVVGTPCCALFAHDNCWYRAVITSIASDFEVEVHYVDYGNTAVVLLSDIRKLGRKFFALPMQAISCCLGFTPNNSDQTSFQQQVDDKELLGQFLSLNGDKWKVRLFDNGNEIGQDPAEPYDVTLEDKESLFEIREYIQHAISPEVKHQVYISHVVSPDEFYVQFESMLDDLTVLSQEITQFYSTLDPTSHVLRKPCPGMLCCAKFSEDGSWYRGRVNCVSRSGLNVKFIDYGNDELVGLRDVKVIDKNFIHHPQQAILCGLVASKDLWTTEERSIFKSVTLDKSFDAKFFIRDGQRWKVSLESDTGSVVDVFMTKDATLFQQAGSDISGLQTRQFLPTLVTPGQEEEVHMSHVTESGEFYVQLSKTAQDLNMVEDLLCELYEGEALSELAVEVCFADSLCCAKFTEDGKWYRACVTKVLSDSQVEVKFVDYGNSEIVTVESIKMLKPELLEYPVQAIKCRFDGSKGVWTAADVKKFEACVLDKPLHIEFTRQEDSSWFVTIKELDLFQAAPNNKTKAFVNEAIHLNICEKAYFLSADPPECIWLQLAKTEAALSQTMDQIACEVTDEVLVKSQVVKGLACIGCFTEDDQWYRAQVLDVDSSVKVLYVDYGNVEWLPLDRLRSISDTAMLLPSQAIRCRLSGLQGIEPLKVVNYLNDKLSDKVVEVKAQSQCDDGSFSVVLYLLGDSQSVNEQIVSDCLGDTSPSQEAQLEQSSPSKPITAEETRTFKLPDLHQGSKVCVKFVSAFLPTKMKLLLTDKMEERDEITRNITSLYSTLDDNALQLKDPEIGQVCCIPFQHEGKEYEEWFRGELLSISADGRATAMLVDYGNCEEIPLSKLRVLTDELLATPVHVVDCSLSGICPSSEDRQWSPECSSVISSHCAFKSLTADIVQRSEYAVEVILYDEDGHSVNDCLVDLGLAKVFESSGDFLCEVQSLIWPKLEAGSHYNVYFMDASDLEMVQLQFADSEAELAELMKQLSIAYTSLSKEELALAFPCVGETCCAQYSEDGGWYRAVITAVSSEGVQVKFVDYGNTDLAVAIKQLKGKFLSLPVQCVECCLKHVVPAPETRKEDIALKLSELCESKLLTAEVTKVSGDSVEIDLFYNIAGDKHSVSESLINLGLAMHSPLMLQELRQVSISDGKVVYNNPKLEVGCCYKVTVLCVESPSDFWCYLPETETELESLSKEIALFYDSLGENDMRVLCLQVGDVCCAQFSENGQWYRSQVTKLCSDNQVHVLSVDYAKQETLPLGRIKRLDAEFAVVPAQVFHCTLHHVQQPYKYYGEGWSKEAITRFQELCTELPFTAEIVGVQGNLIIVELFNFDNETVSGKLLSEGLAVDVKPVLGSLPARANKVEHSNELVEDSVGKIILQDQVTTQVLKDKNWVESEAVEKNGQEDDDEEEFCDSSDQICTESLDCSGKQATKGEVVTSDKPQEKEETKLEEDIIVNKTVVVVTEDQRKEGNEIELKAENGPREVWKEAETSKTVTGGLSEEKVKNICSDEGIVCCDDTSAAQEVKIVQESLGFLKEIIAGDKMLVEKEVQLSEEIQEIVEGKIKETEICETQEEPEACFEEMEEQAQVVESSKERPENITSQMEEKEPEQEKVEEEMNDETSVIADVGAKGEESEERRTEETANGIESLEALIKQEDNGTDSFESGMEEVEAVASLQSGIAEHLETGTQKEVGRIRRPETGIEDIQLIESVESGTEKDVQDAKRLENGTKKGVEGILSLETGIEEVKVIESLDTKEEDFDINISLESKVQEEAKERSIETELELTELNTEEKEFQADSFKEAKEQLAEGCSEEDFTETSNGAEREEQCDKGRLCKDSEKIEQISNHEVSARTFLDEVINGVCDVPDKH